MKVVIALKPDKNPDKMLEERQTLTTYLKSSLNHEVEVIVPTASAVILEGFANGTIDAGYLSATEMIQASNQNSADLLLAGEINGSTTYKSYWVCLAEKPYARIEDLQGKKIAFSSKTSTSGYVIPHFDLIRRKLIAPQADPETFFGAGNVWYGTGYVSAVEQVLSGDAEAAAISYYVLDLDKHLKADQRAKLKKLQEQGEVPTHVIAVRRSLPENEKAALKKTLLGLNSEPHLALRDKIFTSKLTETDAVAHLQPLRDALKAIGK